jgi:hypothetical protein
MIFDYDASYAPPAPTLELAFSSAVTERSTPSLRAFVDSGADATIAPKSLLGEIQATFSELIVGRDVLNRLRVLLDGPALHVQVQP